MLFKSAGTLCALHPRLWRDKLFPAMRSLRNFLILLPVSLASCVGTLTQEHLQTKAIFREYSATKDGKGRLFRADGPGERGYSVLRLTDANAGAGAANGELDQAARASVFAISPGQHTLLVEFHMSGQPVAIKPSPPNATALQRREMIKGAARLAVRSMEGASVKLTGDFPAGGPYVVEWKLGEHSITAWVSDPATGRALTPSVTEALTLVPR